MIGVHPSLNPNFQMGRDVAKAQEAVSGEAGRATLDELRQLREFRKMAEKALGEVEWRGRAGSDDPECLICCGQVSSKRHEPDCVIGSALAAGRKIKEDTDGD